MVGSRPANWLALLVMLPQLVDASRDVLDAVLQDLFGDLFLIEDDNFLDRAVRRASSPHQWRGAGRRSTSNQNSAKTTEASSQDEALSFARAFFIGLSFRGGLQWVRKNCDFARGVFMAPCKSPR